VIAAFGLGGVLYSLAVPALVVRVTERHLMLLGAGLAATAFVLIALNMAWYVQIIVYLAFGIGFYMLHSCIQLHATDLTQTARGAALSIHSCFFFLGHAIGPVYYGYALGHFGISKPALVGAVVMLAIGFVCARFLRHPRPLAPLAEGP
jgi:predicted MFS family arabinose efflux permease